MQNRLSFIILCSILCVGNAIAAEWIIDGKKMNVESDSGSSAGGGNQDNEVASSDPVAAPPPLEKHELEANFGKGVIYPIANINLGYRSDVYETDGGVSGASYLRWGLGAGYQGENRGHLNGIEYLVEGNEFLSGDNDEDELSHRATAYWGTAFTPRNHLDIGIEYKDAYDPRGEEDVLRNIRHNTVGQEPDTWNELSGGGIYSFGADHSRGRLELSGYLTDREYDNNNQEYRNREVLDLSATVYLKFTARSHVFAQVVSSEYDYVDQSLTDPSNGRDLDSDENRYMVGVKWDPTKKFNGIFRIGTTEKEFVEGSQRNDYEETSWDAQLSWRPNFRNNFGFGYSRSPRETFVYDSTLLIDDFVESEQFDVSWSHLWGKRFRTQLGLGLGDDEYFPSGRKDDRTEYKIGLSYSFPRWGAVGVGYSRRKGESNIPDHDYDDDNILLYFNLGAALGLGEGNSRAPGLRNQRSYKPGYAVY